MLTTFSVRQVLDREAKKAPSDYKMKTMKTKLAILVLILSAATSQANLIDLTPGGFAWNNLPPVFEQFLQRWNHGDTLIIAGANINGTTVNWSPFTLFGPPNFGINPQQPNANVTWNLTDTSGYFMQYIWVTGSGGSSQITDNLYGVTGNPFRFEGDGLVTINGLNPITSIVFLGTNVVPDKANTGALFVLAIGALLLTYEAQRRRNA